DVISLGFPAEDIAVAACRQRVEEQDSIAGLHEGGLEILPVVPGGFEPDDRPRRAGPPPLPWGHQFGDALPRGLNGEARPDRFALGAEHGHAVGGQGDIYADTVLDGHTSPWAPHGRRDGIRRTGVTHHRVGMTWLLTMRDGGMPPPGILDKCS